MSRRGTGAQVASAVGLSDLVIAVAVAIGMLGCYRLTGGSIDLRQSSQPHFVLLADALLHGHLWIDPLRAARLGDITPYHGRYYVSFPPMPALLMLPFVAVVGPDFNDAGFTVALGAANTGLAYVLARRLSTAGFSGAALPIGMPQAVIVALLLGLGTVAWSASLAGTVWFTAHVVAVTFTLLYLLECAGRGRPFVAGLALAAAFLARPPAIFGLLFWCIIAIRPSSARAFPSGIVRLCLPVAAAVALLLGQNVARFGSALDFGYLSMRIAPALRPGLLRYGQFSTHFLPRNVRAFLVTPPIVAKSDVGRWLAAAARAASQSTWHTLLRGRLAVPFPIRFDPQGTGIWAVSPALFLGLRPPLPGQRRLFLASWMTAVAVAVPDLLYYNTGWYQFGYRFSLDFIPYLLVPLAMALRPPWTRPWLLVGVLFLFISVASNFLGARWFLHLPPF